MNDKKIKKKTLITIEYTEYEGMTQIKTTVNGKGSEIPEKIKRSIAEDYIRELFYRTEK